MTTGTLGPQDTTSWSFASSYQRSISPTMFNELRVGDTRRSVGRSAAQLSGPAIDEPWASRHSVECELSRHAADVPHQRLSAARIAAKHGDRFQHQRDADCRLADLAQGPAHAEDGRGPAVGAR